MLDQRTDVVMINFMYKVIFLLAPELCTSLTMSGEKGEIQGPRVGVVTRSRKRRIGEISGGETQREGGLLEAEIYKLQFIYSLFQVTKDTVSTPSGRSRCSSFCCESVKEARCLQEPESYLMQVRCAQDMTKFDPYD